MLKDIKFKKVNNIAMAMVPEDQGDEAKIWYTYIINMKENPIKNVLINSKGYGEVDQEQRLTSTLRYFIEELKESSFEKIEPINPELLGIAHEFWVSFQKNGQMYDKKYIFLPETINEHYLVEIPVLNMKGILIV
jgi:hypothetical protein